MNKTAPILFSVVVCTYNRYDLLPKAIDSLLAQDIEPKDCFDIWVMDNSPDGNDRNLFASRYGNIPRLHYVLLDQPGLSNARNEGIGRSSGEYVLFIDDDAEASPSLLSTYKDCFERLGGKVGAIGGKITPLYDVPRPDWLSPHLIAPFSGADWSPTECELPKGKNPFGANVVFRRTALAGCCGFSTALGRRGAEKDSLLSGEESALFDCLSEDGWRTFYAPAAEVGHHVSKDRLKREWLRRRLAWQAVSDQLMQPATPDMIAPMFVSLIQYMKKVPPEHQPMMGLFWDTEDPEEFREQISAIYILTKLLLAWGKYPDGLQFVQNGKPPLSPAD
jgi:glycosyltransferase involved in cell wall biosynthesis